MTISVLRWGIVWMGLFFWGCASNGQIEDFTFIPLTEETFPETRETRFYRNGLGQAHRVIGQVRVLGRSDEGQDSLEKRLLEAAQKVGAQGIINVKTGQTVSQVGRTGIRHDLFGGASKEYRFYPSPVVIEEEQIYMKGTLVRFLEE